MDPLMQPLKRGEVGVSFLPCGVREIVPEADYTLVDRTFQAGDYCKRNLDDVQSGVVVSTGVQAKLAHAISGESVQGWKDVKHLRHAASINGGDYVVYDDWVGQVRPFYILVLCFPAYLYRRLSRYAFRHKQLSAYLFHQLFDEVVVSASGSLVRLPEIGSRLSVGDKGLVRRFELPPLLTHIHPSSGHSTKST